MSSQGPTVGHDEAGELSLESLLTRTRASEERYRALVEATTEMVWETDAGGLVDDMPYWRGVTGQTLAEVRGDGWLRAIHPDDLERVSQRWREAIATGTTYESQYRVRMRDGGFRWYRARGVPLHAADGTISRWVGIFNEIDQLKRRDEGMRFLVQASAALTETLNEHTTLETLATLAVDHLADGAMITLVRDDGSFEHVTTRSRDGTTAAYAAETERMYPLPAGASSGYPRAIRTGEPELVPPDALHETILPDIAVDAVHLERLRTLQMYSAMIVPLVARGTTMGAMTLVLHGSARRTPFDSADLALATELGRRAALALDNSRLFAAERAARAEAVQATRAKSELLAKVSHETRQPVHASIGWIDTLDMGLKGSLTDEQRDALRRVKQNQARLLTVLNDLLDMSTIEAGRLAVRIEDVVIADVMDVVDSVIAPLMREKGIVYDVRDFDGQCAVRADHEHLVGVLTNLLSNAAKFTPKGGRVSLASLVEENRMLLVVEDSGIGIGVEHLERVFEPFFQVEAGFTRTNGGTGLGLAIARQATSAMGGDLTVSSTVGVGSRFTVSLLRA